MWNRSLLFLFSIELKKKPIIIFYVTYHLDLNDQVCPHFVFLTLFSHSLFSHFHFVSITLKQPQIFSWNKMRHKKITKIWFLPLSCFAIIREKLNTQNAYTHTKKKKKKGLTVESNLLNKNLNICFSSWIFIQIFILLYF